MLLLKSALGESMMTNCSTVDPESSLSAPQAVDQRPGADELSVEICHGLTEFDALGADWDDLWRRDAGAPPTVRFAPIALWMRNFSDPQALTVVAVRSRQGLLAGIPLVRGRFGKCFVAHFLPVNCWSDNGDLLVDRDHTTPQVIDALAEGLYQAGVRLLVAEDIPIHATHWSLLRDALQRRRWNHTITRERPVGVIDLLGHWDAYLGCWSRNFRGKLKRHRKKLERLGEVEVRRYHNPSDAEIDALLEASFAIEDRSWKGENGSSILRSPGMAEYMTREAKIVAAAGYLDIWMLRLNGTPIAFEYAHLAKGICFSHKIGFDPEFRQCSPGNLLHAMQLEQYHEDEECTMQDTLGALCESKARWATRTYQVGRMVCAIGSPMGNTLVTGMRVVQQLRSPQPASEGHTLGASAYLEKIGAEVSGLPHSS